MGMFGSKELEDPRGVQLSGSQAPWKCESGAHVREQGFNTGVGILTRQQTGERKEDHGDRDHRDRTLGIAVKVRQRKRYLYVDFRSCNLRNRRKIRSLQCHKKQRRRNLNASQGFSSD